MNPIYDTVLGKEYPEGLYKSLPKHTVPILNIHNMSDGPSLEEIEWIAASKGIYKRDPELVRRGMYFNNDEYSGFDELADRSSLTRWLSGEDKLLMRNIGDIVSPNSDGTGTLDYDGNPVDMPIANITDPSTGKTRPANTAAELWASGQLGDVLDNIEFNKANPNTITGSSTASKIGYNTTLRPEQVLETDRPNRMGVNSYFYPVFDEQHGWIMQEFVGTAKEIEKNRLAGNVILNQYGPKTISDNAFGALGKSTINSFTDVGRGVFSFGTALQDLGQSVLNFATSGELKPDYDQQNAITDWWKFQNQSQDYFANGSLKGNQSILNNPLAFTQGVGQGIGSLAQYALVGRLTGASGAAAAGKSIVPYMMTAGTVINFGEAYDEARDNGLPLFDASILGLATGFVNSAVETYLGKNVFEKWMVGGAGARNAARTIVEETGGDASRLASQEIQNNIIRKVLQSANAMTAKGFLGGAAEEFSEEFIQGTVKQSGQALYDAFFANSQEEGKGYFGTNPFSKEALMQNVEEGIIGAVLGGGGFALANTMNKRADQGNIASFVARNDEEALYSGANDALNKGALTQEQYDEVNNDIQNLVTIRDNNIDLFNQVANYKPEYRGKVADSILNSLTDQQNWIEANSELSLNHIQDENTDPDNNVVKDYINSLEDLIQASSLASISLDGVNNTIIPISTTEKFIEQLRDSGKTQEAGIVSRALNDANQKTNRIVRNNKSQLNKLDSLNRSVVESMLRNETKNSLFGLNIANEFNNRRLNVISNDINKIISDSRESSDNRLAEIHNSYLEYISENNTELNNKVKDIVSNLQETKDVDVYQESLSNILKDLNKKASEILQNNSIVPFIDSYVDKIRMNNDLFVQGLEARNQINKMLESNDASNSINQFDTQVSRNRDLEAAQEIQNIEQDNQSEDATIQEKAKAEEINNKIETTFNDANPNHNEDGVSASLVSRTGGKFGVVLTDENANVPVDDQIFDTKEEASLYLKNKLKAYLVNKVSTATRTDVRINQSNDLEVLDTEEKNNKVITVKGVTSNLQIHDDSDASSISIHSLINNPLRSVKGFYNNGTFAISTNYGSVPVNVRNNDSVEALRLFSTINSIDDFNRLSESNRNKIIEYIPIQYTFNYANSDVYGATHRLFIQDRSAFRNSNKLFADKFEYRKNIIINILSNTGKQYKPNRINVTRIPGNWNFKPRGVENRNSILSNIEGLHISKANNKYVYNFTTANKFNVTNRPVRIGVADNEGTVKFYNGKDLALATGIGSPGNVYLILPSGLTMDNRDNRILKLNPRKISYELADTIAKLMIGIGNGSINGSDNVKSDKDLKISINPDSNISYYKLLEILVPNGSYTEQNNLDSERRIDLMNKTLFVDEKVGLIKYGFNTDTGSSYVLDPNNVTEENLAEFKQWMVDQKNMSISQNLMGEIVPQFEVQDIKSDGNIEYGDFIIDNQIVASDLYEKGNIIKNSLLSFELPSSSKPESIQTNNIPASTQPVTKPLVRNQPVPTNTAVNVLNDDPFKNFLTPRSSSEAFLHRLDLLPSSGKIYIYAVSSMLARDGSLNYDRISEKQLEFIKKPLDERKSELIDVTQYAKIIKEIARYSDSGVFYSELENILGQQLGREINIPLLYLAKQPIISESVVQTDDSVVESVDNKNYYSPTGEMFNDEENKKLHSGIVLYDSSNGFRLLEQTDESGKVSYRVTNSDQLYHTKSYNTVDQALTNMQKNAINVTAIEQIPNTTEQSEEVINTVDKTDTTNIANENKPIDNRSNFEQELLRGAEQLNKQDIPSLSQQQMDEMRDLANKVLGNNRSSDQESSASYERLLDTVNQLESEYIKSNLKTEISTYRKMLSTLTGGDINIEDKVIEILQRSGNTRYAWASMNKDGVRLYNSAEEGTLYHEAFHRVSLLYLNSEDQVNLYKEARRKYNMPTSSDFEIEEKLAESFRMFMLTSKPTEKGIFSRIFTSLKNFITQFVLGKKPKYNDLQTLFNSIKNGGYRYIKPSTQSIEKFMQRYDNEEVGMVVNGLALANIDNSKEYSDIVKTLSVITLNTNGIENLSNPNFTLDYNKTKNWVAIRLREAIDNVETLNQNPDFQSKSEDEKRFILTPLIQQVNLNNEVLEKFETIFTRAIDQRLQSLGLKSFELLDDLNNIESEGMFNNIKNDEISSAYEYSAKDTATADVKMLFETLRQDDKYDPKTGYPNYAVYDVAWFDAFRRLHDSSSIDEMLTRIKSAGNQLKMSNKSNINMYTSLYDKLTGPSGSETLRTRFWITMKKHRHNFINSYYKTDYSDNSYQYFIADADTRKRSVAIRNQWSTMFGIDNTFKNKELINKVKSDWTKIKEAAQRNKLEDYDTTVNSFIDIMSRVNVILDHDTVDYILEDYQSSIIDDVNKMGLDKFRQFALDLENTNGFKYGINNFFNLFLSESEGGVLGKDSILFNNQMITPEKYLMTQTFLKQFSEKYVLANPNKEDDSILGPDGNNVYAYSEYNFLTQSFAEYLKDDDYLNKLKSTTYNQKSYWLDQLSNSKIKSRVNVDTVLSFLQTESSDMGRGYLDISDVEDVMLKMNGVLNNKFPLPTLANKRTYYLVSGLNTWKTELRINETHKTISLDNATVTLFTDYLKNEYNTIQEAYQQRSKFLEDNKISLNEFNKLSEDQQDAYDYSSLILNYHYTKSNGKINLAKGNGYNFRYFKSYNNQTREELDRFFNENNNDNIKAAVRLDLNARINDTIRMMSDLGIISTEGDIMPNNKNLGLDSKGNLVITANNLIDSNKLLNYRNNNKYPIRNGFSNQAVLHAITDYAINTAIGTIEFEKLVSFDLAYFKDEDDRVKRYSALSSTGAILRTVWDSPQFGTDMSEYTDYNTVTLKSNIISRDYIYNSLMDKYIGSDNKGALMKLYKQFWNEANDESNLSDKYSNFKGLTEEELIDKAKKDAEFRLSYYKKVDQTDAQTIITPKMFRGISIMLGEWSEQKEEAYNLLNSDKELTEEETLKAYSDVTMNVLKMIYIAPEFKNNQAIPIYDKMSLATIFKRMVKGSDLEILYDNMVNNDIDMVKFDSAVKSGGRQAIKFYERDSQTPMANLTSVFSEDKYKNAQEFRYLRRQLVTDPHHPGDMALGTQAVKIGMSGVLDGDNYILNDANISGKDLKQIWKNTIDEMTKRGYGNFVNRLGIKEDSVNKSLFMESLRKDAMQSNQASNLIEALSPNINPDTGRYVIEPSLLPNMSWVQSRLLSLIKKDVIDTKLPGNAFIQMSNFGFKNSNIKVVNDYSYSNNKELRFKDDSNRLESIVSISLFKQMLPQIIGEDGELRDMTFPEARKFILNNDISTMGYRIPTQGQNSMVALKIVDVLPETVGDVVVLPAEFTTLTGSDFDIDKLYMVNHNYRFNRESLEFEKVPYDVNSERNSNAALGNLLLDVYLSVLTSDNHLLDTTTPLDATTKPIKDVVDLMDNMLKRGKINNLDIAFPRYQLGIKTQNTGADAGIAPMALANVHHVFTSLVNLEMNTNVQMSKDGNTPNIVSRFGIGSLHEKYDKNGVPIMDWLSALINAHVDAAKDPYILKLNVNSYTYDVTSLLIRSGFGENTFYFMPQPVLVDLAKEYTRLSSGRLGLTSKERKRIKWKNKAVQSYVSKFKELSSNGYTGPTNMFDDEVLQNIQNKEFLIKQLSIPEESRNAEWYFYQMAIYNSYLQLEKYGKALSNLVSKSQIDTGKYGKNATAITAFMNGVQNILDSEYFIDPAKIYNDTFLGQKLEYSIGKLFDVFGKEFIEMSPRFQNIATEMLRETDNFEMSKESIINTINNSIKHGITSAFFKEYVQDNNISIRNMFYGNNSLVNRFESLVTLIESNDNFKDLRDNEFIKLLKPNSVDNVLSERTGLPRMFNIAASKQRDSDSMNTYVNAFRDVLTHPIDAIRNFGNEMIVYAYMTSGGMSSGLNNMMNLIPYDILANIQLSDEVSYNDFIHYTLNYYNGEQLSDSDSYNVKDTAYRNLWYDVNIIPEVGSFDDTGKVLSGMSSMVYRVQNKTKEIGISPNILMNNSFTSNYFVGKNKSGQFIFTPFISLTLYTDEKQKELYKYIGYVKDGNNIFPVYRHVNKLGYRNSGYTIKETGNSIIPSNIAYNKNNSSVEVSSYLTNLDKDSYYEEVLDYNTYSTDASIDNKMDSIVNVENQLPDDNVIIDDSSQEVIIPEINNSVSQDTVVEQDNITEPIITTQEVLEQRPISNIIIKDASELIVQYDKNPELAADSFEFNMMNSFQVSKGNFAEDIDDKMDDISSGMTTYASFLPSPNMVFDKPIAVLRNSNIINNPVDGGMNNYLNKLKNANASVMVLNNDQLLQDKLNEIGLPYVIMDKPKTLSGELDSKKQSTIEYIDSINMYNSRNILNIENIQNDNINLDLLRNMINNATSDKELSEIIQKYIC